VLTPHAVVGPRQQYEQERQRGEGVSLIASCEYAHGPYTETPLGPRTTTDARVFDDLRLRPPPFIEQCILTNFVAHSSLSLDLSQSEQNGVDTTNLRHKRIRRGAGTSALYEFDASHKESSEKCNLICTVSQ
jgi:hypothetical protein